MRSLKAEKVPGVGSMPSASRPEISAFCDGCHTTTYTLPGYSILVSAQEVVEMIRSSRNFRPRACQHCGGDAFLDSLEEPEWRCLQCGRVVAGMGDVLRADAKLVVSASKAA